MSGDYAYGNFGFVINAHNKGLILRCGKYVYGCSKRMNPLKYAALGKAKASNYTLATATKSVL